MNKIAETELILTPKNEIYHLHLSEEQLADDIIVVGDPSRVNQISKYFDTIELKVQNREFITHTGFFKGKRISVISTGIGTDNIDIVLNELDALANIDFQQREQKSKTKSLNIIRLGTSGAIQEDIEVDSFILSSHGIGLDGLAHFYSTDHVIHHPLSNAFAKHCNWSEKLPFPYSVSASESLMTKFHVFTKGITVTAPGFYAPQGRQLRLTPAIQNMHETLNSFRFEGNRIANFEMETSALYFLGKSLGHNTITICAIIGNRMTKTYSKDYKKTVENLITTVLEFI